jgi:hypothetical protein
VVKKRLYLIGDSVLSSTSSDAGEWRLYSLDMQKGGEWTREEFKRDSLPKGFVPCRLCAAWTGQLFLSGYVWQDSGTKRTFAGCLVLKYNASCKMWKPLPPLPEDINLWDEHAMFVALEKELIVINSGEAYGFSLDHVDDKSRWRKEPKLNIWSLPDHLAELGYVYVSATSSISESELAINIAGWNSGLSTFSGVAAKLDLKSGETKAYTCWSQDYLPTGIMSVGSEFLLIGQSKGQMVGESNSTPLELIWSEEDACLRWSIVWTAPLR